MLDQQGIEDRRIGKTAAHDARIGDRMVAIGKGHGAGLGQQAELGHLGAAQALGRGGGWQDVDNGSFAGAAGDELHQGHFVDHRVGVRHGDDGSHPTGGSGATGGGQGFLVFGTRLELLPESYRRSLVNGIRRELGFEAVPIRLTLRSAKNPFAKD